MNEYHYLAGYSTVFSAISTIFRVKSGLLFGEPDAIGSGECQWQSARPVSPSHAATNLVELTELNQLILALSDDNDTYNRYQWFQDRLYTRLRDEERAEAYTLAEKWLQVIYQHGTIVKSTAVN